MDRRAIADLARWKDSPDRKPLIIRGARQVGKTWLMKEFGRVQYGKCAYVNFDNNERMRNVFSGDIGIKRLISALRIETGVDIDPADTLIVFDELQEVPRALTSLKYFCENAPEYHIVGAASLLGVALHPGTSFPVGKVDFLDLHPLDFAEFLRATGNRGLAEALHDLDFPLVSDFRERYLELLKAYCYVGGMPEVVRAFADSDNHARAREIQLQLLEAYEQDFSKHAPIATVPRLRMLWSSIPSQLAKENRKFIYGLIRQGARAREYELALAWLIDCGLVHKVGRVTKPGMPLSAYQDLDAFKLLVLDVGLLGAVSGLDARSLLEGNRVFEEFKGALMEQYVLQQLVAAGGKPFYWSAKRASGEIDFVIQHGMEIVPIEVKAAENLQSKSLKSYCQRFSPKSAIRTSTSDYRVEPWLTNLPLYAIGSIREVLGTQGRV